MKRKIILISILTVSILISSFVINQRRVDASVSDVLYYGAETASELAVDAYLFLRDSAQNIKKYVIKALDPGAGSMDIEEAEVNNGEGGVFINETGSYSGRSITVVPEDSVDMGSLTGSYGHSSYDPANTTLDEAIQLGCYDQVKSWADIRFCTYKMYNAVGNIAIRSWTGSQNPNYSDDTYDIDPVNYTSETGDGDLGTSYSSLINDVAVNFYEFIEDVPIEETCFDGIQNQDETGVDCGGVCLVNFGLDCTAWEKCFNGIQDGDETGIDCGGYCLTALGFSCNDSNIETCSDNIMNQDETGIDYGGVCGIGDPVAQPVGNFTDTNVDGLDDISGLDSNGGIGVAIPGVDASSFDPGLPGDTDELGDTDWTGLITGYLSSNPLVTLATGSQINLSGSVCSLDMTLFNKSMSIDFCSLDWMVDIFGTFVLGLMTIRSVFIAMGV